MSLSFGRGGEPNSQKSLSEFKLSQSRADFGTGRDTHWEKNESKKWFTLKTSGAAINMTFYAFEMKKTPPKSGWILEKFGWRCWEVFKVEDDFVGRIWWAKKLRSKKVFQNFNFFPCLDGQTNLQMFSSLKLFSQRTWRNQTWVRLDTVNIKKTPTVQSGYAVNPAKLILKWQINSKSLCFKISALSQHFHPRLITTSFFSPSQTKNVQK